MVYKIISKFAAAGLIAVFYSQLALAADPVVCNGCVGAQDIASKSIINSKIQDYAVTSAKIANGSVTTDKLAIGAVTDSRISSGAVLKSLNGLRDNVSITGGNGIQVTSSGSSIVVSASGGTTTNATNEPKGIIDINSSNYTQATISDGDTIRITGQIVLAGNFEIFRNKYNLHIQGGSFQGSGSEIIYLAQGTVIENTTFTNLKIHTDINSLFTNKTIFSNCIFSQIAQFDDSSAIINGANIKNLNTRIALPIVENSYIDGEGMTSDGVIAARLDHNVISNAKIYISEATNNTLSNVSLISNGGIVYLNSNDCQACSIFIRESDGQVNITNNRFASPAITYSYILKIQEDVYNNSTHAISRIENNTFTNQALLGNYYVDIAIDGAFNNPYALATISRNTFLNASNNKADKAISDTSSGYLKKLIQSNITSNIDLGVPEDGVGIANNITF